ncbi:hypothetical protein L21SP5_01089 [Salinivirga cyanobacteriivorans]|uniref:LTD domain-containing protein n=1 Tax=Salinivirga cyanobacteriivorans TaxID=1307839 RepID=A0A0S2HXE1_9BACT|nr:lamin tail domain-containing protein [Salinivirga cyanobacteriivorans]ALO14753.1 hypothetical protein L21SP5_01089 [Salinivirga cyanobacteriivorans]
MRIIALYLFTGLLLCSNITQAQLSESFTDMNFTTNPEWTGDTGKFTVLDPPNSGDGSIDETWNDDGSLLRSEADSGDAALVTASSRAYGEWLFSIADGRGWAISGSNDFYVVLMSDTNNPEQLKDGSRDFNGYYLRFDGNEGDSFTLHKQTGTTSTLILNSNFPDGDDATTSKTYSVKVSRNNSGEWNLFIEEGLYLDPQNLLGTATDNEVTTSSFFGIVTNIANPGPERVAYIDQIITRDIIADDQPPFITEYMVTSTKTIDLHFDEYTDSVTAHNISNYNLQGTGSPDLVGYVHDNHDKLRLTFNSGLQASQSLTLDVSGVADLEGNTIDTSIQVITPAILNQNITESFSDFNLNTNPQWQGEVSDFEILDPPTEGDGSFSSEYVTDGAMLRSRQNTGNKAITFEALRSFGQWSFTIADGANWSISSTNDFYILLNASTNDPQLLKPENMDFYGYYLRFDGGADDSFVLYKQTGTQSAPIIETGFPEGSDAGTPLPYSVKITRTETDGWKLYIDEGVYEQASTLRGTSADQEITTGNYFGICTNISTPSEERVVYLDSIYIGEIIYDTIPPALEQISVQNANTLSLSFSESLDTSLITTANFEAAKAGVPQSLNFDANGSIINLYFPNDFTNREQDTLYISGLQDIEGNLANDTSANFTYFIPLPGEIVINEILFDTYPPVGLPEYDYIELYNRSEYTINIKDWTLQIGEDNYVFPSHTIMPESYLIITSSAATDAYSIYGETLGLISTSALTNDGKPVTLKDSSGQVIHDISYTPNWYHDPEKEDGGWSIEQIDPDTWCAQASNWHASENAVGGTPGSINSVDAQNPDNTAPSVVSVSAIDDNTIIVQFSESVPAQLINSDNITISPDPGNVVYSTNPEYPKIWQIATTQSLPPRTAMEITISNIVDYCDNAMADTVISFYFVPSEFQQIIFNEILAEPNSETGIAYEYLELYNRDSLNVSLQGWTLQAGSRTWTLPANVIPPNGYLLILPEYMAAHPDAPENAIYLFDDSDLSDGGTLLQLNNADGKNITWVDYDDQWHDNNLAELGGYALERIDTEHLCGGSENWRTSTSENFGTPNMQNAVFAENADNEKPEALYYILPGDTTIQIEFDSPLWPEASIENLTSNDVNISNLHIPHPKGREIIMELTAPLAHDINYTITLNNFEDCNRNVMEPTTFNFKKPVAPEEHDLVINEILFNPPEACDDFVEIYNISDQYLAMDQMYMGKLDESGQPDDINKVTTKRYVLPPEKYYILTSAYDCLEDAYTPVHKNQTLLTNLPSLANDAGAFVLMESGGNEIDRLEYNESMHHALLDDPDGVSLERISPLSASDNPSNWHSAAADVGFATPTRENSQYNTEKTDTDNISLTNETLSPDGDGYQDYLKINYRFAEPGNILTIRILNHRGLVVRNLLNNESVSSEGFVTWDGTDDDGQKLPVGIYIIYAEWFDNTGNQGESKQTCVIAGGLK